MRHIFSFLWGVRGSLHSKNGTSPCVGSAEGFFWKFGEASFEYLLLFGETWLFPGAGDGAFCFAFHFWLHWAEGARGMLVWAGCLGLVPASQLKKKLINEAFSFPSNCHSLIHQGKQRGRTSGNSSNEENKLCICLKQPYLLRAWARWPEHRQERKKKI